MTRASRFLTGAFTHFSVLVLDDMKA